MLFDGTVADGPLPTLAGLGITLVRSALPTARVRWSSSASYCRQPPMIMARCPAIRTL